jgi:hypothetical protein
MGFVDEDREVALFVGEEALERDAGIKDVVVVADDCVGPNGEIEGEFERADLVFAGECFD